MYLLDVHERYCEHGRRDRGRQECFAGYSSPHFIRELHGRVSGLSSWFGLMRNAYPKRPVCCGTNCRSNTNAAPRCSTAGSVSTSVSSNCPVEPTGRLLLPHERPPASGRPDRPRLSSELRIHSTQTLAGPGPSSRNFTLCQAFCTPAFQRALFARQIEIAVANLTDSRGARVHTVRACTRLPCAGS